MIKAAIVGISGPELTQTEAQQLRAHQPAGIILFARNILTPDQLAALILEHLNTHTPHSSPADLRDAADGA